MGKCCCEPDKPKPKSKPKKKNKVIIKNVYSHLNTKKNNIESR